MDLFRRKQKLIFWIVTIIIVPSFVLVWGVRSDFDRSGGSHNLGKVNGKNFSYQEFENLRRRLQAAVGGLPLRVAGAPGAGTPAEEFWKYALASAYLQDAEKAGSHASDLQVGTYLQATHPVVAPAYNKNDPAALDKAVEQYCRQMQISRAEFLRGVKEWQTICNYVDSDSRLAAVNDDTIFAYYRINHAELVVKRIRIRPTDAIREQAKNEVMTKPAADLDKEVRDYIAAHSDDDRFRQAPTWRFAYVWMPRVPESAVRAPTDEEIEAYYNANRGTMFANQPLEQAKDKARADLARAEAERQTLRNFNIDVDPQLRSQADLAPEELAKLTQLAKYGVKAGDTGPTPLPTAELAAKLPAGAGQEADTFLKAVDGLAPTAARDSYVDEWKTGYNLSSRPIKVDDGYIRLKLLDYSPSKPVDPSGPDGNIKPDLREFAVAGLVADRVDALVRDKAVETESRVRQLLEARRNNQPAPDAATATEFDGIANETIPYSRIPDSNYDLVRLTVGDMIGPLPYTEAADGARGQELVAVIERHIPPRSAFDAEPKEMQDFYRQTFQSYYRGNCGVTYTMQGPAAIVQPSPAMMGDYYSRLNRGEIAVNREFLTAPANSEG